MGRSSKSFLTLALGGVLLIGVHVELLRAEEGKRLEAVHALYPSGSEIAFEWQYSCPGGKGCSFICPGSGGAADVTKLVIHLGTIPLGASDKAVGIFYEFATLGIPRSNGFSVSTGMSTLSCQVNGMNLDYSGPPKN